MSDKAVITCALNGVLTDPKQHHVPVTPEEMAREAKAAFDAGASAMHIHLRQQAPNKGHLPSWDVRPELSGRARLHARDPAGNGGLQRRLAELSEGEGRQHLGLAADDVRQC